jgi:hypothetical protein
MELAKNVREADLDLLRPDSDELKNKAAPRQAKTVPRHP